MNFLSLPLATALVAGFTHALEADHVAAVSAFVARRPHPLRALAFGLRWAMGHSLAILVVGGVLIALDLEPPAGLARALEFGVGGMLLLLGAWALGVRLHPRALSREHAEAHALGLEHSHVSGSGWVGVAHGLAGTSAFVALLPAAVIASPWHAGGYLLLFGAGTALAMGVYALLAGAVFHRVGDQAPAVGRVLRRATAVATMLVGAMWMYGALFR